MKTLAIPDRYKTALQKILILGPSISFYTFILLLIAGPALLAFACVTGAMIYVGAKSAYVLINQGLPQLSPVVVFGLLTASLAVVSGALALVTACLCLLGKLVHSLSQQIVKRFSC